MTPAQAGAPEANEAQLAIYRTHDHAVANGLEAETR